MGVIELVFAIVSKEVVQAGAYQFLVAGFAAQGPADQRGRSIAHVAGNHVVGQFRALHMPQRGIDRMHQIQPGVDQRAIKVEDHQLDFAGVEWAIDLDHAVLSEYPQNPSTTKDTKYHEGLDLRVSFVNLCVLCG